MLCVVPSLVAISRAKVFGVDLAQCAKDVWRSCDIAMLLGEMRFVGVKEPSCQVAMYVHVGWVWGSPSCNYCMATLCLNEHRITDRGSIDSFFRLHGLQQAVSLQLTIPGGADLPYPWAWCHMRCGEIVAGVGMPRNVCCLFVDRLCYTCCALHACP